MSRNPILYPFICVLHLVCCCVFTVPSAAVIIGLQTSSQMLGFSISTPRCGIAGSYATSMFSFLKETSYFLPNGCTDLHSHQECRGVPFSPHRLQHVLLEILWDGHSDWCEVIAPWTFDLPSSDFPGGPDGKASAYNAGDLGSIPGREDPL